MSDRDRLFAEVAKLVNSHSLHGSESLTRLLEYLAKHAVEHPGTPLKEYQIATELYGRPADFDPQVDSTIRVQAGRLRAKLADYYATEGAGDRLIIDLPRGAYLLSFHERPAGPAEVRPLKSTHTEPERVGQQGPSRERILIQALVAALLIVGGYLLGSIHKSNQSPNSALASIAEPVPREFQLFWQPFVKQADDPWVVFSNAAFVGRPETGMRYYNKARDSSEVAWDHYTGVGEVLAVHSLDQVFELFHRNLLVKRGSLFSLDDAKNNNLIFMGSPAENLSLGDIPSTKEFVFRRVTSGPRKGDLAIVSEHRVAGEANTYLASPSGTLLTEDYAVIGLVPGLNPTRSVLILAGTTTFGTQAAVEFVSRRDTLKILLSKLGFTSPGDLKPFEALLRVKVARGVPTETELVATRVW
jgi:hypothetical protein